MDSQKGSIEDNSELLRVTKQIYKPWLRWAVEAGEEADIEDVAAMVGAVPLGAGVEAVEVEVEEAFHVAVDMETHPQAVEAVEAVEADSAVASTSATRLTWMAMVRAKVCARGANACQAHT